MTVKEWHCTLRAGQAPLTFETGRVAQQADGSVWIRQGSTILLVTAVSQPDAARGLDFLPLTVEYRERLAGAGRIPGNFLRRETRPGTQEILGSRLIDRSIRPFFPKTFRCETQVLASVLSYEAGADPAPMGITGASAALAISDIPWAGPVAGVRVIRLDGELLAMPTAEERERADLDLVVTVGRAGLVMVEGCADEVPEELLLAAFEAATVAAQPLLSLQETMRAEAGRPKRLVAEAPVHDDLERLAAEQIREGLAEVFAAADKRGRRECLRALSVRVEEALQAASGRETAPAAAAAGQPAQDAAGQPAQDAAGQPAQDAAGQPAQDASGREAPVPPLPVSAIVGRALRAEIRRQAVAGRRIDGRDMGTVRPIAAEVSLLPGAHGSSLFTRGETQALVTCTLGAADSEQLVENLDGVQKEAFLLHYNFPPYSVGEARPLRGPGRREVGHGWLARRALLPVLPRPADYPYTIRIESEITASNGSSSMATVCGGTLAMMDAGVPLRRPVAGVAMGLIAAEGQFAILSDILGDEDHLGDMDFKVAGSSAGVTAVQLDNKIGGLPAEVLARAMEQARAARLHILAAMEQACGMPRTQAPAHAPKIITRRIRENRIRDLIGPGGRNIQGIQQETGVKIDVGQDGQLRIYAAPGAKLQEALARIEFLTGEPRVESVYQGRVTSVTGFGCFVELFHGIEGLVHISELDEQTVSDPGQVAAVGDMMKVKVLGVSPDGKIKLSRRAALEETVTSVE